MSPAGRAKFWLYHYFWTGLDWIYPPKCSGCGLPGSRWCDRCEKAVYVIQPPICQMCGQYCASGTVCKRCREKPPHFIALRSWGVFNGPLRAAIHKLKYKRDVSLGEVLSRPLARYPSEQHWDLELVVPVPLSLARLHERGYNQASLLAIPLALQLGLEHSTKALIRTRDTPSQVGLSASERMKNVSGAFQARREIVENRKIIVVDDVTTTGSTLEACAIALLEAGAKHVYGLTLARSG